MSFFKDEFAKSTGAATASQAISGLGFAPDALYFWGSLQTAYGSIQSDLSEFHGFAARIGGTTQYSYAAACLNGGGALNHNKIHSTKAIIMIDPTAGTVLARADIGSWDADGFTLSWTTNNATAYKIHFIAWGGLTNAYINYFTVDTAGGDQDITAPGFTPDYIQFLGTVGSDPEATSTQRRTTVGIAKSTSYNTYATRNAVSAWDVTKWGGGIGGSLDGPNNAMTGGAYKSSLYVNNGSFVIKSLNSDGFSIDWQTGGNYNYPASAYRVGYMCLKGLRVYIASDACPGSTGTQALTGCPFAPEGIFIIGEYDNASMGVGAASKKPSTAQGYASWCADIGGTAADEVTKNTKCYGIIDDNAGSASVKQECGLSTWDSGGVTLDWTTAVFGGDNTLSYVMFGSLSLAYQARPLAGIIGR